MMGYNKIKSKKQKQNTHTHTHPHPKPHTNKQNKTKQNLLASSRKGFTKGDSMHNFLCAESL